jgi:hypothetical protein
VKSGCNLLACSLPLKKWGGGQRVNIGRESDVRVWRKDGGKEGEGEGEGEEEGEEEEGEGVGQKYEVKQGGAFPTFSMFFGKLT